MSAVLAVLVVFLVVIVAGLPLGHFMYPPRLRRRERARVAERAARPVVDPAAAARNAAATLRARITEER
ncbi:hypothetical protein ABZ070_10160 [Streptomyces sp. NPDC006283]|uniref:hypothetical protein n=1 Tax=Streptomyces sp. NPDC006283 TaxID=3156741 RepID=UPI0033BDBB31